MCGIAGFVDFRETVEDYEATLRSMSAAMFARGPDSGGAWYDRSVGVGLAHRRLAILDLSPDGHQPMRSADGRWIIVFNGEVYNHAELRESLEADGYRSGWRGGSDTEVILECVARWGLSAVDRFRGMFSIALWDRKLRSLHLVRDRLGIKPLFLADNEQGTVFGSDLRAMGECSLLNGEIDPNSVAQFLRYNYVPAPETILRDVRHVIPGTVLSLDFSRGGRPQRKEKTFWSPHDLPKSDSLDLSVREAEGVFEEVLRSSIRERMVADVPVGAFLSGGVDSSLVVGLMQQESSRPIRTFTIGFREDGFDEAAVAREYARRLGTDHTEHYFSPEEALERIPSIAGVFDQPFADSSQLPTLLVSEIAREQVTVSLSGDGGDELFGGYLRYPLVEKVWSRLASLPQWSRRWMGAILDSAPERGLDLTGPLLRRFVPTSIGSGKPGELLKKGVKFLHARTLEESYEHFVSQWPDAASMVPGAVESASTRGSSVWSHDSLSAIEKMMLRDLVCYLPDDILVKLDRCTMAVSLEGRVPLLDHRVVEMAWKLPLEQKAGSARNKQLLRNLARRIVGPKGASLPKMGFGVPIGTWLRGPLRGWADELLSESSLRATGLLDPAKVRNAWSDHVSGRRDWKARLWGVLMLQGWALQRIDRRELAGCLITEADPWIAE